MPRTVLIQARQHLLAGFIDVPNFCMFSASHASLCMSCENWPHWAGVQDDQK
jgi:hypothetical protein